MMLQLKLVRSFSFQMPALLSQGIQLHPGFPYSCFVHRNYWERILSQNSAFPCLQVVTPAAQVTSHWSWALGWHLLTPSQHLGTVPALSAPQGDSHRGSQSPTLLPWQFPSPRCVEFGTGLATLPLSPSVSTVPDLF